MLSNFFGEKGWILSKKWQKLRIFAVFLGIGVSATLAEYSVPNIRPNIRYSVVHYLLSRILSILFGFKFKKWISSLQVISFKSDMISHAILKYILDFKPQSIEKIWFRLWSLPNVYYPAINLLSIYLYSVSVTWP